MAELARSNCYIASVTTGHATMAQANNRLVCVAVHVCMLVAATALSWTGIAVYAVDHHIHRATLWGGADREEFKACGFTPDGRLLIAGSTKKIDFVAPGHHLGQGDGRYFNGQLLEIDPNTNTLMAVYTTDHGFSDMRIDDAGRVYLWARNNTVVCLSPDLQSVMWTHHGAGSAFDVSPDGQTFTLVNNTVTHIDRDGKVLSSFNTIKGKAKAIAYDQASDTIFVAGVHAQHNLFWPWLIFTTSKAANALNVGTGVKQTRGLAAPLIVT